MFKARFQMNFLAVSLNVEEHPILLNLGSIWKDVCYDLFNAKCV